MLIHKISDTIVFSALKNIKYGFLEITKIDGEILKFGNPDENLKVTLKIKDESLMYNLIKNGSVGLGESYMKDFFTTNNLSDLISILYEVKNTFGEQHTYVFKTKKDQNLIQHVCKKKFHVSPFIPMNCIYFFRLLKPGNKISVIIDLQDPEGKILYASQDGVKSELNNSNLIKSYLKHPLMTFKIILAIHFEAFKLWTKGIKFISKKIKIKNNITLEN